MADGTLVFDTKLDNTGLTTGLSKVGGVAKGALGAATAAVGALAVGVGVVSTKFVNATADVAEYGDNIDKMSQKMGLTAEAYQEWDAVMQHSGTSMESMKASMKTLANAAETGNEAFQKIGITQKDLQSMSQQDLFEATIAGLQNVEDTTERTYLAGKLLGRGATELGALLNTSAEDTQAMRDRVRELGGVMSDDAVKASAAFQDQLQDMQTAFQGVSRNLMAEFLPSMTEVMGGLTEIFSGNSDKGLGMIQSGITKLADGIAQAVPKVAETATKIVEALATSIIQNLPLLINAAMDIIKELSTYIIQNLPLLIETGIQIISELAMGLAEALPTLIPTIVDTVITIAETLIDNIDLLIDAGIQLILGLAEGLVEALPRLIERLPEIIVKIVEGIIRNAPKLLEASLKLMITLGEGLIKAIPEVLKAIPKILSGIWDSLKEAWPKMKEAGLNLIKGLGEGIVHAKDWLIGKIKSLCNNALGAIKSFFGISSPSKKFKWIGEMCVEGMEQGLEDMDSLADGVTASLGNITANVSGGNVGVATNGGLATAVAQVLEGMGVYMDGRSVGEITAASVNETLGRFAVRRA